jgi:hypothetical protein
MARARCYRKARNLILIVYLIAGSLNHLPPVPHTTTSGGVQLYNTERPHSSLKYQTPEEFVAARPFVKAQWAQSLELRDGSAPAPIAQAAE